jgi:hypothetical protein
MPVERNAQRIDAQLGRRDKRFLVALACAGVLGVGAGIYVYAGQSSEPAGQCVSVTLPSTMGGATLRPCGAAAMHLCRVDGRHDARIAAACRREGVAVP